MKQRHERERVSKQLNRQHLKENCGLKSPVVQGFKDMLDLNKLIKRITPEQVKKLKEQQLSGNYGIQNDMTIRDVLLQSKKLTKDFMSLPAVVREKFGNDEFAYQDFLQKNKDNKYALPELYQSITDSDELKRHIDKVKKIEQQKADQISSTNKALAKEIADALKSNEQPK